MKLPLFLSALLIASYCEARVGETQAQLEQRYGASTADEPNSLRFSFKGFAIMATMIDGRSAGEIVIKENAEKFSDTEIAALMTANVPGGAWKLMTDMDFANKKWATTDGQFFAMVTKLPPYSVIVGTKAFIGKAVRDKVDKDRAGVSGF